MIWSISFENITMSTSISAQSLAESQAGISRSSKPVPEKAQSSSRPRPDISRWTNREADTERFTETGLADHETRSEAHQVAPGSPLGTQDQQR
jgi:hypothetical protein